MNTRHPLSWFWTALAVLCLTVPFLANKTAANKAATQPQGAAATANLKTAGGLTVVTFIVNPGTIKVNLPDDMRAGDTISGTVITEPKGNTKEERGANQSELNKLGIRIKFSDLPEEKPKEVSCSDVAVPFTGTYFQDEKVNGLVVELFEKLGKALAQMSIPVPTHPSGAIITPDPKITPPTHPSGAIITPDPKITTPPGMTPSGAVITPDPKITPPGMTAKGAVITPDPKITPPMTSSGAVITPDPKITPPTHPSGAIITPDPKITNPPFTFPPLGQTGRPIVVTGPFDGNSSNTRLDLTGYKTELPRSGKNTENVSGGFRFIAESPRKAVFESPTDATGELEIVLREGNQETKGTFRNLKVDLTAPKTSLLKGESTELHVEVNGLEGLKQPVPLTLESHGVITMAGGIYQSLVIQPSQVGADGRYTTTRGITGVQTGVWGATATVVTHKFDVCLQDDTAPARRILWNTFNGDYIFVCPGCWPPKGQQGGASGTTGESGGGKTGGGKTGGTTETGGTTASPTGGSGSTPDPPGSLTGQGKMIMKGCVITLTHNAPDRRVFSRLDSCTTSGTSKIEDPKTKVKFTITDRNIADNTCSVQ